MNLKVLIKQAVSLPALHNVSQYLVFSEACYKVTMQQNNGAICFKGILKTEKVQWSLYLICYKVVVKMSKPSLLLTDNIMTEGD